jgi:hypothetical protein
MENTKAKEKQEAEKAKLEQRAIEKAAAPKRKSVKAGLCRLTPG